MSTVSGLRFLTKTEMIYINFNFIQININAQKYFEEEDKKTHTHNQVVCEIEIVNNKVIFIHYAPKKNNNEL